MCTNIMVKIHLESLTVSAPLRVSKFLKELADYQLIIKMLPISLNQHIGWDFRQLPEVNYSSSTNHEILYGMLILSL